MARSKAKIKVKTWLLYSLLGSLVVVFGGIGVYIYTYEESPLKVAEEVEREETPLTLKPATEDPVDATSEAWEAIYPVTSPMEIGSSTVLASVAKSWPDRIKGLSDTPFLPEHVVKFFVFDAPGHHSIWMKDMNYAIDIIWVNKEGEIVYLVEDASPESYPARFEPTKPATFVIETVSGFIAKEGVKVGDSVVLPKF